MKQWSAGGSIIFEIENIIEVKNNGDIHQWCNDDRRATKGTVEQLSSTDITRWRLVSKKPRFLPK